MATIRNEDVRLQAQLVAQDSRIRELEAALMECKDIGISLCRVLKYFRDDEPTAEQVRSMSRDALDQ